MASSKNTLKTSQRRITPRKMYPIVMKTTWNLGLDSTWLRAMYDCYLTCNELYGLSISFIYGLTDAMSNHHRQTVLGRRYCRTNDTLSSRSEISQAVLFRLDMSDPKIDLRHDRIRPQAQTKRHLTTPQSLLHNQWRCSFEALWRYSCGSTCTSPMLWPDVFKSENCFWKSSAISSCRSIVAFVLNQRNQPWGGV